MGWQGCQFENEVRKIHLEQRSRLMASAPVYGSTTPILTGPDWAWARSTHGPAATPAAVAAAPPRNVRRVTFAIELPPCLGSVKEKAGKTSQGYTERPCPQNLRNGLPAPGQQSRDPGDAINLDIHALPGRRGLDGGAGGLHALEVLLEHAVEDGEIVHAAQEDAHLDHVLDGRTSRLQHGLDVVEGHAGLLGEVRRDDLLGRGVERTLPRNEEELPALDALGDGRLRPFGEAGLGRRLGVHDFGFHAYVPPCPFRRTAMSSGNGAAASAPPDSSWRGTQARTSKPLAHGRSPTDTSCSTRNVLSLTSVTVERIRA